MKLCKKCQIEKELSEFHKDKYAKDGKKNTCRECLRTYIPKEIRCYFCREWFTQTNGNYKFCKHKCRIRHWSKIFGQRTSKVVYSAEYRRTHKDQERERKARYYQANKEIILEKQRLKRKRKHAM